MKIIRCFAIGGIFLLAILFQQGNAQTETKLTYQSERVKKCDTLYYYGIDVSHVRVTDATKVSRSEKYSLAYPSAWVAYVEKEMPPYGYVQPALKKAHFFYIQDEVQYSNAKVSPNFIIAANYSFPLDTVAKAVKSYKLTQSTGVGLVIIPENFNKNFEAATSWITFFDIKTREVLWAVKTTGKCSHMGYTAHWGSGIVEGFWNFINPLP